MKRWRLLIVAVLFAGLAFQIRKERRFRANWESNARACVWEVVRSVEIGNPLVGRTNLEPPYLTVAVITNGVTIDVMIVRPPDKPNHFVVTAISSGPDELMIKFDSAAPERGIVRELFYITIGIQSTGPRIFGANSSSPIS